MRDKKVHGMMPDIEPLSDYDKEQIPNLLEELPMDSSFGEVTGYTDFQGVSMYLLINEDASLEQKETLSDDDLDGFNAGILDIVRIRIEGMNMWYEQRGLTGQWWKVKSV